MGTYSRLTRSITRWSEYVVSSITWHQWHQTAEIARRIGLSSACAWAKVAASQGRQAISCARFGRGEKWRSCIIVSLVFPGGPADERRAVQDDQHRVDRQEWHGRQPRV